MIELIGTEKLARTCEGIAHRMINQEPALELAMKRLEDSEEKFFEEGYVRTGALKESLTGDGPGAIRRVTRTGFEFGSSIHYAAFQVEDPGPVTPAGGLQRRGHPSAILKVEPEQAHELTVALGEYVMRGHDL